MKSNKNIACDLHDYLEIACLYTYQVKLTLANGETFTGVPKTTRVEDKKELLVFEVANTQQQKIETNKLKTMEVLTPNAKFTLVEF